MTDILLANHPLLLALALIVCVVGSFVAVTLWLGAVTGRSEARLEWTFLAGLIGGTTAYATQAIAKLGHDPHGVVGLVPEWSILALALAMSAVSAAFFVATVRRAVAAIVLGGVAVGLALTLIRYVGAMSYQTVGTIRWDPAVITAAFACASAFSMIAVATMRRLVQRRAIPLATAALSASILCTLLVKTLAFNVEDVPADWQSSATPNFLLAIAIALCAIILSLSGIAVQRIGRRSRRHSRQLLRRQALHDTLTGLPNRRSLREALALQCRAVTRGSDEGRFGFAMLKISLTGFDLVNQTLGYTIGDIVLKRVAKRLRSVSRGHGLCAHLGGDDFALLLPPGSTIEDAQAIADLACDVIIRPALIERNVVDVGVAIGIVGVPDHGRDAEEVMQHANAALREAEGSGRIATRLFAFEMVTRARERRALQADLRRALLRSEFSLVYHPLFDPIAQRYAGAEALLRWQHPTRGFVSPAEFIPLAEELGIIVEIGRWTLARAVDTAAGWPAPMVIAVNVSPLQLEGEGFVDDVLTALQNAGLPPHRLEVEITETTLLRESGATDANLAALSRAGVAIALDDFGTGYSSLTHLHRHPIDRIKIDKSFFDELDEKDGSRKIVGAITSLGADLGVAVTAEGIETQAQADFAAKRGCNPLQGYFYSKPVPAEALPAPFHARQHEEAAA